MKLSEDDGTEEGMEGKGRKRQVGQSMQILPEQRANQGARQPLQRSGLPLVTGGEEEEERERTTENRERN